MQGHDSNLPGFPDLLLRALDNKCSALPSLVPEGLAFVWGFRHLFLEEEKAL